MWVIQQTCKSSAEAIWKKDIKKPLPLRRGFSYPEPESNRHGFPQVFETSASTNSAIRA